MRSDAHNFSGNTTQSDAIAVARVICILGVVYVHAWTGLSGHELELARGTAQENLRWILMDVFGRSAVPLLGLISGWLVAGSRRTLDWREHIARKARTIVLPMLLWNVIALVLVCGTAWLFTLQAPTPPSLWWIVEEIFILTRNPDVNVQMPFLRDLFVCMVMAPVLVRTPGWTLAAVVAIAAAGQVLGFGAPLILRPSILMFFALGIAARRLGMAERVANWPLPLTVLPFAALMTVQLWLTLSGNEPRANSGLATLDLLGRAAATVCFWRISWMLARSRVRSVLLRVEPYMFLLFCSHLVLIWLGGPLLGRLTGPLGSKDYPAFLLLQPMLVLAVVIAFGAVLQWAAPGWARVLSGGRLTSQRRLRMPARKVLPESALTGLPEKRIV
jgi:Uncharacterized protein conserved in bacteria